MNRERQIARLTGIAVELDDAALGLLSTFAESLHASPGTTRDLTSKGLAAAQHDRDRGVVREPVPRDHASEMRGAIMAEIAAERDRQPRIAVAARRASPGRGRVREVGRSDRCEDGVP